MARFQAIHRRVREQQTVAIFLNDAVVRVAFFRVKLGVLRKVAHQRQRQNGEVVCGRKVPLLRKARRVQKLRVFHAKLFRFAVHARHKFALVARNRNGQRDGCIVTRLNDHAAQQILSRHRRAGLDEHARAFGLPRALGYAQPLAERELFLMQRVEHQVCRHQLGERCRVASLLGVGLREHLAAGGLDHEIGCGIDRGHGNR